MSLSQIIFGGTKPDPKAVRDPAAYKWRRIQYSAQEIRDIHTARSKVRDVVFSGWPPEDTRNVPLPLEELLWHYGDIPQQYSECWEYNDGVVLVCIVMSTFAGTFAEHNDTELVYYVATPKRR